MDIPNDIIKIVRSNNLEDSEKRERIKERGYTDSQIDDLFSELGYRSLNRSKTHVIPGIAESDSILNGEKFGQYINYLKEQTNPAAWQNRKKDLVSSISRIHPYLEMDRCIHGLVIGDVQSGKTSNFMGLISAAIDSQIQLIIILSGTTNLLRDQTQIRFEEAFGENDPRINLLTTKDKLQTKISIQHGPYQEWQSGDFKSSEIDIMGEMAHGKTIVAVVKKEKTTLTNLELFLDGFSSLKEKRILIIDDESDSASINTIRPRDESALEHPDEEQENDEETATAINHLIRSIVAISDKSIYLGYTATPYAALLSNPFDLDPELGPSLYPRDLVMTLPTPGPHCGITEYFSDQGYMRRRVSTIPMGDEDELSTIEPDSIPESLEESVLDYVISGALKIIQKGSKEFHHTMLVHNHIRTENHRRVAMKIKSFGSEFFTKYKEGIFGERSEQYQKTKSRWEDEFLIDETREAEMDDAVKSFLKKFSWTTMVLSINSSKDEVDELFATDKRLDYTVPGTWAIAVGGTILSRGLTVEGLCISYFTRRSALYDSLTQMARWCGYHSPDDQKLIRVRTTSEILEWFQWVYSVDTQIREDVAVLEKKGGSPVELSPKILRFNSEESRFLPTRRGAMYHAQKRGNSYSGTSPSTLTLPLENTEKLDKNIKLVINTLQKVNGNWEDMELASGCKATIDIDAVIDFIDGFEQSDSSYSMDSQGIISYIQGRQGDGELTNWTVCVYSPAGKRSANLDWGYDGIRVPNVTERGKMPQGRLDVLFDKRHTGEDVVDWIVDRQNISRNSVREVRPVSHAQLGIYLLSSTYDPPGGERGFISLYPDPKGGHRDVVAFGLVLPDSDVDVEQFWMAEGLNPVENG